MESSSRWILDACSLISCRVLMALVEYKLVQDAWVPERVLDELRRLAVSGNRTKEGQRENQGLGFLADGTRVVVNQGLAHLGQEISVVVLQVLPQERDCIVFANPVGYEGLAFSEDRC
jgi:uncharacterized protein YacL